MADLEFAANDLFVKIRSQTTSGLENQKQAAIILAAVEETIVEQNEQLTPLAYFGALMTILEQQRATANPLTTSPPPPADSSSLGIMVAVTYLLAIVFPRIPGTILKLKFETIAQTLGATLEVYQEDQPLVRSVLACFEFLLAAQDTAKWNTDVTCKKLFQVLLIMSVDGRPKVRRRAHEAVRRILSRPPPPTTRHPATLPTIEYTLRSLQEYAESVGSAASAKDRKELEQQVLHVLVFLKMILPVLAMQGGHDRTREKLRALCEMLLRLPVRSSGGGNTVLTQWIFSVLDSLFGAGSAEKDGIFPHLDMALLDSVIRALLDIRPYQNDITLVPAWLELIGRGFNKLAELATEATASDENTPDEQQSAASVAEKSYALNDYPKLLTSVFTKTFVGIFSQASTKPAILAKASTVFAAMIRTCITPAMVKQAQQAKDAMQGDDDNDSSAADLLVLVSLINGSLSDIKYRAAWGAVLSIAEALFDRIGPVMPEAVRHTLDNIMTFRDDRAYGDAFPYKQELEVALHAAVQALGLEVFVSFVALNIENENPKIPRRPYLLATFAEAVNRPLPKVYGVKYVSPFGPHTLRYLGDVLLPLAERMLEKSGNSWAANRQVEAKLYETLGAQIWSMVPALCSTVPGDAAENFPKVAAHFGRILQALPADAFKNLPSKPDFRPTVCEATTSLIEGYQSAAARAPTALNAKDLERATLGLARLREYASRFLNVLCNNYTNVQPDLLETSKAKGQQLQVLHERENQHYAKTIRVLLTIADEQNVTSYFMSLVTTLLESQSQQHAEPESAIAQLSKIRDYAVLDLQLILLPFLPDVKTKTKHLAAESPLLLFYKVLTGQLRDKDPTLQKRTYKALNHVVGAIPASALNIEELITRLLDPEVLSNATSGAKNARIQLLQRVCETIPLAQKELLLQFVPVALSEVMLATKEASEKARNSAYECLVAMGRKMMTGGLDLPVDEAGMWDMATLQQALDINNVNGNASTGQRASAAALEGQVNLREFFMMVIAGLAGETSTMQSASIAALSRLLFEFGPMMDDELLKELIGTIVFVMNTKNREVIKAALGFVKVAIVSLRQEILEDELENLIVAILTHSRQHKSHFKAKVRHIFERLVRKFSYEAIEGFVPEEDKKLLVNIRKRREREKKRKALARQQRDGNGDDDDANNSDGEQSKKALAKGGKAVQKQFEDALYGSESELDDSDDEDDDDDDKYIPDQFKDGLERARSNNGNGSGGRTMIREDGEVADFLDANIVSRVTSAPRRSKNSASSSAAGAKGNDFTHAADGRMMIDESGSEDENDGAAAAAATPEVPEDHYKDSLRSEVAFTRTADGRVRFLKPDAKRKRAADDDQDPEAAGNRGATGTGLGWGQRKNASTRGGGAGLDQGQIDKMLGKQFKAKRAKGDVKKAGGPDPFAYIPLTSKVVGGKKRKAAKVAGQFKNIIKATQSGGDVGAAGGGAGSSKGGSSRKGNKKHK
ncbi:hypothetical protein HDU89_008231 [Geranomyces variabilis]|nr:hypothetical protein HDU89_008231 [Geranomyces variabilis]